MDVQWKCQSSNRFQRCVCIWLSIADVKFSLKKLWYLLTQAIHVTLLFGILLLKHHRIGSAFRLSDWWTSKQFSLTRKTWVSLYLWETFIFERKRTKNQTQRSNVVTFGEAKFVLPGSNLHIIIDLSSWLEDFYSVLQGVTCCAFWLCCFQLSIQELFSISSVLFQWFLTLD